MQRRAGRSQAQLAFECGGTAATGVSWPSPASGAGCAERYSTAGPADSDTPMRLHGCHLLQEGIRAAQPSVRPRLPSRSAVVEERGAKR